MVFESENDTGLLDWNMQHSPGQDGFPGFFDPWIL